MTTPIVTTVEPTKAKSWVALVGSLLSFALPLLASVQNLVPEPWPAVIGGVCALGTWIATRLTPNHPANTSLVPNDQIISLPNGVGYSPVPDVPQAPPPPSTTGYRNPWEQQK